MAGTVECLQTRFSALSIPAQPPPREPVQREPFTPLLGRAPFLGDCTRPRRGVPRRELLVLVAERAKKGVGR